MQVPQISDEVAAILDDLARFYEDFYRENNKKLPTWNLKEFTKQMFHHCPLLRPHLQTKSIEEIIETFTHYKVRVPVCGAIILNSDLDKVLLVKGWSSKAGWGFPKGKINQDELEIHCAAREVWEETGFECSGYLREGDFLEVVIREQRTRLYIIHSVPEDYSFIPRTRKEISKIKWIPLASLPASFHTTPTPGGGGSLIRSNSFWMVVPFVNKLKKWIANNRKNIEKERKEKKRSKSNSKTRPTSSLPVVNTPSTPPSAPLLLAKLSSAIQQYDEKAKQDNESPPNNKQLSRGISTNVLSVPSQRFETPSSDPWRDFTFDRKAIMDALRS